jgi:hypothetical protein
VNIWKDIQTFVGVYRAMRDEPWPFERKRSARIAWHGVLYGRELARTYPGAIEDEQHPCQS